MSQKSEQPAQLPSGGGSYVRQKTGKLKPVEQTDEAGAKLRRNSVEPVANKSDPRVEGK